MMAKAVTETCNMNAADHKYFTEQSLSSRNKGKLPPFNTYSVPKLPGAMDLVSKVKEDLGACNREVLVRMFSLMGKHLILDLEG